MLKTQQNTVLFCRAITKFFNESRNGFQVGGADTKGGAAGIALLDNQPMVATDIVAMPSISRPLGIVTSHPPISVPNNIDTKVPIPT